MGNVLARAYLLEVVRLEAVLLCTFYESVDAVLRNNTGLLVKGKEVTSARACCLQDNGLSGRDLLQVSQVVKTYRVVVLRGGIESSYQTDEGKSQKRVNFSHFFGIDLVKHELLFSLLMGRTHIRVPTMHEVRGKNMIFLQ